MQNSENDKTLVHGREKEVLQRVGMRFFAINQFKYDFS
jgi:hypothetical protein